MAGLERSAETYVRRFYVALDAQEFDAAWLRLPAPVRASSGSFDAWRAGYKTTLSNDLSDLVVDTSTAGAATVSLTLRATDLDACADEVRQRFVVRWTLRRDAQRWIATGITVGKLSGRTPRLDPSACPDAGGADEAGEVGGGVAVAGGDDAEFCDTHPCIPNYENGRGSTVMCADGEYSRSGGIQGACSHHGGVSGGSGSSGHSYVPSTSSKSTSSGGTVHVRGYYRKDGTYVHSYTRRAPCSYC
ncbi:MAG TPA: hypothetical protein VGM91_12135 [Conexibacter sp.]